MRTENIPSEMSEEDAYLEAPVKTPKNKPEALPEVTAADAPDEDEVLAFTHQMRKRVVRDITKDGTPVNDSRQMGVLLQTLDGMDRSAITRKRMRVDQDIAKGTNESNAGLLAAVLRSIPNVGRPAPGEAPLVERAIPVLPDTVDIGQMVEGQTEKAPPQDTYQSFMARNTPAA